MLKTAEIIYLTILAVLVALWSIFVGTLEPIHLDRRATKAASVISNMEEAHYGTQNDIHRN